MYREIKNWLLSLAISVKNILRVSDVGHGQINFRRRRRRSPPGTGHRIRSSGGGSLSSDEELGGTMVKGGGVGILERKLQHDPIVQELRRTRADNARHQQHDYSHVFRGKTRFDFIRMSFVMMGIEFVYSAETAFVTPILLGIGIEHHLMTMVWGISPFIGFFMAPVIGKFSDRCRSRFGRRRPILVVLAVGLVIGCILVPYGENIGRLLGDVGEITTAGGASVADVSAQYRWAIIVTIFGTILLDFCADSSQAPSIAYLLDVSLPEDHGMACSTYSLLAGVGGFAGYLLGAIDWSATALGRLLGGNINTVFMLVTLIFICCLIVTICSFKEIPLTLMESDELLQPLTETIILREKEKRKAHLNRVKDVSCTFVLQLETCPGDSRTNDGVVDFRETESLIPADGPIGRPTSIGRYLKNLFVMPMPIAILCVTNLFCWMSHLSYTLYFTDFVGEIVFGGDPMAMSSSAEYQLYIEGVRYGCFGMAINSLACSTYSYTIEKLISVLSARTVYCGGLLIDSLGMLCLASYPTKVTVYVFSVTSGISAALLFTMPFIILGKYHAKGSYESKSDGSRCKEMNRGLATDISVVGSMLFVAQIILSLGVAPLASLIGETSSVMYNASVCSLIAAICASQVVYMDL